MRCIPLGQDSTALELGCGDGYQLNLLRKRFARVFAIDPERRPASTAGFVSSVAEALPFPDNSFDLVISSSVAEHLIDRRRAIEEALRVLRPRGYIVHIVPTCTWKFTSLLLNPLGYPIRVIEKWWALRHLRREPRGSSATDRGDVHPPGILQVLGRWFYPPIHGTYPSHLAEYRAYARERWIEVFAHPRLKLVAEVPLLFFTQFGFCRFGLLSVRLWAARHGLASTRAFIFQTVD